MDWTVYIIRCSDNTLYTGITTDTTQRFKAHQGGNGAKYFRSRKPGEFVFIEKGHTRSSAAKREYQIKKMIRAEKEQLIRSGKHLQT